VELKEFAKASGLAGLTQPDKILHLGWLLHAYGVKETFDQASIRACYKELSLPEPNFSEQFARLADRKPEVVIKQGSGLKLEHSVRAKLDEKYGQHETTIAVSQQMKSLVGKLSDVGEKIFLDETIKCYHVKAFRAATVMAWDLAYDHLVNWVLSDAKRLADFNSKIAVRVGARRGTGLVISKREDFEDLKESEVLDICSNAGVFASDNTK
jgi:hypothetical protein